MAFDFKSRPQRPRKGDRLFPSDLTNQPGNTLLRPDPDTYTVGYRRAAECLAEYALTHEREGRTLVDPIVFLYRHHIELALKRILYCVPGILAREWPPIAWRPRTLELETSLSMTAGYRSILAMVAVCALLVSTAGTAKAQIDVTKTQADWIGVGVAAIGAGIGIGVLTPKRYFSQRIE